MLGKGGEVVTR